MTAEEREQMERHPRYTLDILERVSAFRGFARTAALHHERLDGSGYPFHYDGEELDLSARILVRRRHLRRDQLGPAVPEGDGAGGDHVDPRARSRHAALSRRARRAARRARGDERAPTCASFVGFSGKLKPGTMQTIRVLDVYNTIEHTPGTDG